LGDVRLWADFRADFRVAWTVDWKDGSTADARDDSTVVSMADWKAAKMVLKRVGWMAEKKVANGFEKRVGSSKGNDRVTYCCGLRLLDLHLRHLGRRHHPDGRVHLQMTTTPSSSGRAG